MLLPPQTFNHVGHIGPDFVAIVVALGLHCRGCLSCFPERTAAMASLEMASETFRLLLLVSESTCVTRNRDGRMPVILERDPLGSIGFMTDF
jgi:hypothetical protein